MSNKAALWLFTALLGIGLLFFISGLILGITVKNIPLISNPPQQIKDTKAAHIPNKSAAIYGASSLPLSMNLNKANEYEAKMYPRHLPKDMQNNTTRHHQPSYQFRGNND